MVLFYLKHFSDKTIIMIFINFKFQAEIYFMFKIKVYFCSYKIILGIFLNTFQNLIQYNRYFKLLFVVQYGGTGVIMDGAVPIVKRGKERENPKKKKPTLLKKV